MINIMYIPVWILIGIGIIAFFYYPRSKAVKWMIPTDEIFDKAEETYTKIMKNDGGIDEYLDDERNLATAMRNDIIRLRKRFKEDDAKQREYVLLWSDYTNAIRGIITARIILDVSSGDTAFEDFHENSNEHNIEIEEIDKKVRAILGDDSEHAKTLDKVRKKEDLIVKAMNEIGDKHQKTNTSL